MFKIKVTLHELITESGMVKIETSTYYHGEYDTIEKAKKSLSDRILENLKTLNQSPYNDFKVTFNDESALAAIQCWTGKEANMTKEEFESDRDYYNVAEYDIVYSCEIDVNIIPDEWLLV